MMQVLDAGAEDFVEEEDSFEVLTDPDDFSAVRLAMEEAGIPMASAEVTMIPQTYVELTDPKDIANIQKTLDMLDDDDDEVVLHILEVIEQREKAIPTGRLSDVDKALEEFQTYYNIPEMNGVTLYPEETAESVTDAVTMVGFIPKRPWIRVLGTIAATVIFMFAMLIGAQAAGIDVFGAIGRWTDETFHFVSFPHSIPQDQETTAPNLENVETCNVIKGALKDCEIPEELAPTWYPVGIEASDPKILSDKLSDTVHIFFSDGDKLFFNLNITRYRSTSYLNTHIFEKDDALVEQYVSGSRTFYIMSNLDAITAVWSDGLFVETISGNLQIDEVKAIVDSIGG